MKLLEIVQNLNANWHNKYGLDVKLVPIANGMQLYVGYKGGKFTVRLYPSGGDIKVDFSQVKNSMVERDLKAMLDGTYIPSDEPLYESSRPDVLVAGFDESGKGDVFCGLVTAGVYMTQPYDIASKILGSIGVKDSKELTDQDIIRINNVLRSMDNICIVERYVTPLEFNRLQFEEGMSTNDIMKQEHLSNLEAMLNIDGIAPTVMLIDQFCEEEWLNGNKLNGEAIIQGDDLRYRIGTTVIEQKPKGEENLLVAAASIIARKRLLDEFDELGIRLNTTVPRGANKKVKEFYHSLIEPNYDRTECETFMKTGFKL